jgi:hypothetical protein
VTDVEHYFTQSIVGAPFSVVLGTRAPEAATAARGVEVSLEGGLARLSAFCKDELLIGTSATGPLVRRLSSPQRRWLERHALLLAGAGILALCSAGLWTLWIQLP